MRSLAVVPLLLFAGCSGFDRDFDAARSAEEPSAPLVGPWEGTWQSDENGHHGDLRSIISRTDSGYRARYDATFTFVMCVIHFEYEMPLTAAKDGDVWRFRGSADLDYWIAGGVYEYEGLVSGDEFIASYRSSFDAGVIRMKRVR